MKSVFSIFDQEEVTRISLSAQEKKGRQEGIMGAVNILRRTRMSDREIAEQIKAEYHLKDFEVDEYLKVTA